MKGPLSRAYDYIVIGAGSAGCAVAARLSEDAAVRVALIESGGRDKGWKINLPAGVQGLIANGEHSWGYQTEAQKNLDDRSIAVPRGKVLGGSSSINAMVYIRGNPIDYEKWVELGATGWGWNDVLPYFRRAEDQQRGEDEFHGAGGPVGVSDNPIRYPICDDFIRAAKSLGFPWTPDFNGLSQDGVGFYQYTVKCGLRSTTARAYLHPARKRKNLTVITNAEVERIVFTGDKATGVRFQCGGDVATLTADKEIIVSGGTVNTPKLLMLSGIGPTDELRVHGIHVHTPLEEVGKNLKDHLFIRKMYRINQPLSLNCAYHSIAGRFAAAFQYATSRSGPLAYPISPVGIFGRTSAATDRPDLQFYFSNYSFEPRTAIPHRFHGVSLAVSHLHPTSSGTIRLSSACPAEAPRIDPNFFATPEDRQAMKEGVRLLEELVEQPALKRRVSGEISESSGSSEESRMAYIRRRAVSVYHPVGTCRMGDDEDAVLDSKLRVRGVRGLRVIDASVMPTLISGNTNATSIMIGEKGADLIKAET